MSEIGYPEDCRDRLSKEFNKIIEDNGWAEDIRLAREALARSHKDAQELVEMAERENIAIITAMQKKKEKKKEIREKELKDSYEHLRIMEAEIEIRNKENE
jgi:hypothetical protein